MTEEETLAFARRFLAAIQACDADAVRGFYAPEARIWHNTDGVDQTVEQMLKVLRWFARRLPDRRYRLVRLEALKDGYLQQHVLEARLPTGEDWSMPACVIVRLRNGLITDLEEYLDSRAASALDVLNGPARERLA